MNRVRMMIHGLQDDLDSITTILLLLGLQEIGCMRHVLQNGTCGFLNRGVGRKAAEDMAHNLGASKLGHDHLVI
jgi:hypothetical protein